MEHYYGRGKMATFILNRSPEGEDAETISELNALLAKMGCGSIEVKEYADSHNNAYYPVLVIHFNQDAADGYNRRAAGRRLKRLTEGKNLITVGEVRKMLEDRTADEVAKVLGVSRSTLFRRIKDKHDLLYF